MDVRLGLRAAAVQAAVVALLFALLVALPLREGFFRDYGTVTGPVAWTLAALATAAILRLAAARGLVAALASGLAAAAIGVAVGHTPGLVVGLVLFGVAVAFTRAAPRARRV